MPATAPFLSLPVDFFLPSSPVIAAILQFELRRDDDVYIVSLTEESCRITCLPLDMNPVGFLGGGGGYLAYLVRDNLPGEDIHRGEFPMVWVDLRDVKDAVDIGPSDYSLGEVATIISGTLAL